MFHLKAIDIMQPPDCVWIGRKGENEFREVPIDCTGYIESHPNATITAMYQSGENEPFPVVLEQYGTVFTWKPRSEEITDEYGRIEIVLTDGDKIGASKIVDCFVDESLIDGTEHPAELAPAWSVEMVQDVTEQADRAEAAADRAEEAYDPEAIADAVEDYLDEHPVSVEETDPTVPAWAKQPTKPTYTASEVGALPSTYVAPVQSVNGMTGKVVISTGDPNAVLYTPQTLTTAQQEQARENLDIRFMTAADIDAMWGEIDGIPSGDGVNY